MALKVVAWDDTTDRFKRTDKDPADITGGSAFRADCAAVSNGATSVTVVFSSVFADTSYTANAIFENTTDANPIFQPVNITNKTTTGFTASWNAPVDSGNYTLCYSASPLGAQTAAGVESLASGISTKAITLSPPQSNTDYAIVANFNNSVDADPLHQPITITSKATSGFTLTWNSPTDSVNYSLEYSIAVYT